VLEVSGLRKRFGEVQAVDGVGFTVGRGESVGLLGPNGAGKTTTLSMVVGVLAPDAGEVRVDGGPIAGDGDPRKRKIGYVPQELALYDELTALANLRLFGALYGLTGRALDRAIDAALELVGLRERAAHKAGTFSGGMKRRLNLAAALLHEPELLLLDEPTVGVDPQSRNAIFENLEALKARGIALLYTTHYMEEVERLCERVVIIDHGRIVADDTLRGLYRKHAPPSALSVELEAPVEGPWLEALRALPEVAGAALEGERLRVALNGDLSQGAAVLAALQGQRVTHFAAERPDLETVFLTLTGKRLRDA
jgi:ABC-2 type transport system ATP-binding protein